MGLKSAGDVLFGKSLLTDQPFSIETLPEAMPTVAGAVDSYVGANASIAADHESLKTPGTASQAAVARKIEQIADDPALTDKQKRAAINDLRKQLGLSKGDMKKVYTKPLEQAYAQKIEALKASGIDTPEKQQLLEQLESKKKLYNSMYKAGGCVKKVFKGIGKGLGVAAKVAGTVAMGIANPASLIPAAASLVSKIPGVSKVTDAVQNGINKVEGWTQTGMGYVQKGIQFSKDIAAIFGNFGGLG
ncbi:MAG TPA: hypothetical protein VFX30_09985 [bacterium]|nr:hypothetical protein [bacterium]